MSLLMDALKKAEESKRAAEIARSPAGELSLAPLDAAPTATPAAMPAAGSPLPELAQHLDAVDADLAAVTREPMGKRPGAALPPRAAMGGRPSETPPVRDDLDRASARNVFSAKQTEGNGRGRIMVLIGIGVLAAMTVVAYFWWQLENLSSGTLGRPPATAGIPASPPAAPAPLAASNAVPPSAGTLADEVPATRTPAVSPPKPSAASAPTSPAPGNPDVSASPRRTLANAAAEMPAQARRNPAPAQAPRTPSAAQPAADTESPVRLSHSQPKANLVLEQAYDDLQGGRLDLAQRAYQQVLRADPKNTDALLGLATIAARKENVGQAQALYQLALESDPSNPTAQAGVIQTRGHSEPAQSESRLKTALAAQPDSPALLFALGNLYAREQRWSEAQQAYFRAYSTEPDNADFIFNLAVSLDQMHQARLAIQYYQMALKTADMPNAPRTATFDRDAVRNRLAELQP